METSVLQGCSAPNHAALLAGRRKPFSARTATAILLACSIALAPSAAAAQQPPPATDTPPATAPVPSAPPAAAPPATPPAATPPAPAAAQPQPPARVFRAEELDQLVAPIALYPDDLIAMILTAATYPLEIVIAARWLAEPKNAALKGDAFGDAVRNQSWDPSVKSLAVFPAVLKMMSAKLEWTQKLGDAFLAQPQECAAAVQRLRALASKAGKLNTTPQQKVEVQGETIIIQPADPEVVYVPTYDPATIYGDWPYSDYPPYSFATYPGYGVGTAVAAGLAFGFGVAIARNAWGWGWGRFDWRNGNVSVNPLQFNRINNNRGNVAIGNGNVWQHNAVHRQGVAYRDAATRQRFAGGTVRTSAAAASRENFRGFNESAERAKALIGGTGGLGGGGGAVLNRPVGGGGVAQRPAVQRGGGTQGASVLRGAQSGGVSQGLAQRQNNTFRPGNGAQTRAFSDRGAASRQQSFNNFQQGNFQRGGFQGGGGGGFRGGGGGGGFRGRR